MAIDKKFRELEPSVSLAVIRGESCFEKKAFEDTEKSTRPPQLEFLKEEYPGKYSRYRKKNSVLKLFLRPILFHGQISFDNLTYFKLYGNLNGAKSWLIVKTQELAEEAERVFGDKVSTTTEGKCHLGAV